MGEMIMTRNERRMTNDEEREVFHCVGAFCKRPNNNKHTNNNNQCPFTIGRIPYAPTIHNTKRAECCISFASRCVGAFCKRPNNNKHANNNNVHS